MASLTNKDKEAVLAYSTFLANISDSFIPELEEFHESVRDEAQNLMLTMA